jgi:hypothetical protein
VEGRIVSDYAAYCRLKAHLAGTAVRLSRSRNFAVSDLPLVLIPIKMAGEAPALFALGVADLNGNLDVFTCPNPPNRDHQYAFLAQAAVAIRVVVDQWMADPALAPQLICQSGAAATLMLAVVDRMAFVNPADPPPLPVNEVGRIMAFFDRRFERADSAAVLPATEAVCSLYATGQDPQADTHLGTLVEWLRPADGQIISRVQAAECLTASVSTDPALDNEVLDALVRRFYEADRDGDAAAAALAQRAIEAELELEVRRRYELIREAMAAVTPIPETAHAASVAAREREQFDLHFAYVQGNQPLPRGFSGTSGMVEFVHREVAHRDIEVQAIQAPGRHRAEARLSGEILHGTIVARRQAKRGKATIIDYDVGTQQDRLRIRLGTGLTLMGNGVNFEFSVEGLQRQAGRSLVTLRMTAGMRKTGQPVVGQTVELGPKSYFSRRTQLARDRINAAGVHRTVTGAGARGTDYLTIVAGLEGRR